MRTAALVLCVLLATSTVARGAEVRGRALRTSGIAVLTLGVLATVFGQVLAAEAIGWQFGNGLGEHYDPTPSWVPAFETTGWSLLGGGQAMVIGGITMLSVRF